MKKEFVVLSLGVAVIILVGLVSSIVNRPINQLAATNFSVPASVKNGNSLSGNDSEVTLAVPHYKIVDLGVLSDYPATGNISVAKAINDKGEVVGYVQSEPASPLPFWWKEGRMVELATMPPEIFHAEALAINNSSQIVGQSSFPPSAWIWPTVTGAPKTIPVDYLSTANDINNLGIAVGHRRLSGSILRGFIFNNATGEVSQIDPPPGFTSLSAQAVNDSNQIACNTWSVSNSYSHACFWDQNGLPLDLGTFGGIRSTARDINSRGVIVGDSYTAAPNAQRHAFKWSMSGGGLMDLGSDSVAYAINDSNHIVGQSLNKASLWWAGKVWYELNSLIPEPRISGWSNLEVAYDINELNQIVGQGVLTTGERHAFLMTPVGL